MTEPTELTQAQKRAMEKLEPLLEKAIRKIGPDLPTISDGYTDWKVLEGAPTLRCRFEIKDHEIQNFEVRSQREVL